jgi:hypothetical protein
MILLDISIAIAEGKRQKPVILLRISMGRKSADDAILDV